MSKRKQKLGDAMEDFAKPQSHSDVMTGEADDAFLSRLRNAKSGSSGEVKRLQEELKNALVPQDDNSWLLFGSVRLSKTGLEVPSDFTDEDKDTLGQIVVGLQDSSQFWMGDWANLYLDEGMDDNQRGDVYNFLAEKFGVERKTLNQYASVCRVWEVSRRRETLSYSHHQEVAFLPKSLKGREEDFLNAAVEGQWSVRQLRDEIQKERDKLNPPTQPDTLIDTKHMVKQFRTVTKLFSADVSTFSAKKRDEYRGKVTALRRVLDDLENKLDG